MAFAIGQRVGDYEVVRMLGAGGMGHVYQVRNVISNRIEAMKVLLPDLVAEPDLAARFISEIRMLASFDHPNIAQLHTAFQADNQLVMMMEFVEGTTLEQRAKQGPIPPNDTLNYMQQVLAALSYAHGRGVVHRDIKPANIMVTSHGVVKLMDFGIAKSHTEMDLTRPGTTMGSLYYMSPEQVRGGTVDARSDIYSVGIMMYELLAGRRPFEADSAYGILQQQCNVAPQPPIAVNQQLPQPLSDLIMCALAKDPANRFQNAQAVANALKQIAAGLDTPAKETEVPFTPVVLPGVPRLLLWRLPRPRIGQRGSLWERWWFWLLWRALPSACPASFTPAPKLRAIAIRRPGRRWRRIRHPVLLCLPLSRPHRMGPPRLWCQPQPSRKPLKTSLQATRSRPRLNQVGERRRGGGNP